MSIRETSIPAPPTTHPPSPRLLAALFLLAALPRLTLALIYIDLPIGLDDMFQYDMLARSIASGNGYRWYARADVAALRPYLDEWYRIDLPTSEVPLDGYRTTFRAPGYPLFLAGIYALAPVGDRLAAARLVQVLLGALLAPLTALLAARILPPSRAPFFAGTAVAFYPILWMYPIGLGSENLFLPLCLGSGLALLHAARSARAGPAAAAGLFMGAAALTRGGFALTLPLVLIWLARRVGLRRAALATIVAAGVFLPWSIRNSLVLGRPAFVETTVGYNLFIGYHPEGDGGFVTRIALLPVRFLDDGERDRWTMEQALGHIRSDPARAVGLSLRRLAYFWGWETREIVYFYGNNAFGPVAAAWLFLAMAILVLPWVGVALSAPVGLAVAPKTDGGSLSLVYLVGAMLPYIPILAEPRFHLPVLPWLAAYAAFALTGRSRWRPASSARRAALLAAGMAMIVLLVLWTWDGLRLLPRWQAVSAPGGHQLYLDY